MKKRGETLVTFGKYAGETYETAYKDKDYRFWFMGHDPHSKDREKRNLGGSTLWTATCT